jgi:hypothetical protein
MKKLILAATALASLTLMETTPASALGCTTTWVDGRLKQVCDSGVAVTLNNMGRRPAPRCQQRRVPGTLQTVYVCG